MQSREAGVHYTCCCTLPLVAVGHLWGFNKVIDFVWLAFRSLVRGFFSWGFYNQHVCLKSKLLDTFCCKVIIKHLDYKLFKWLKSKGRKARKQLRQRPYSIFVSDKGLLDLEKYARLKILEKAQ